MNRDLFSCFVKLKHVFMCLAKFQKEYTELHLLGEGGFGSVFAGYRQEDKLPVGVFRIFKILLITTKLSVIVLLTVSRSKSL